MNIFQNQILSRWKRRHGRSRMLSCLCLSNILKC